jgi:hypothetical protein
MDAFNSFNSQSYWLLYVSQTVTGCAVNPGAVAVTVEEALGGEPPLLPPQAPTSTPRETTIQAITATEQRAKH